MHYCTAFNPEPLLPFLRDPTVRGLVLAGIVVGALALVAWKRR